MLTLRHHDGRGLTLSNAALGHRLEHSGMEATVISEGMFQSTFTLRTKAGRNVFNIF